MTFNRDFATRIINQGDRDVALFFAGREAEIARFDSALRETSGKRQAVFRIFQGAPGCGKTSLAAHLRANRTTDALFVPVGKSDLKSRDALFARVGEAIDGERSRGGKVAHAVAQAVGAWLKIKPVGDAAAQFMADMTAPKPTLVLHMDEAQLLDQEQDALVYLHTDGLDLPTVCLFTGLSHTESRIRSVGGLSRLAKNVTTNMGRMADAECAESTAMMLDKLGVEGADAEGQKAVETVVEAAHGWPQHLFCAQQALCRELVRTDGSHRGVDPDTLRADSEADRHAYYQGRLEGDLARWPKLAAAVAAEVMRQEVDTEPELTKLCRREVRRLKLDEDRDFGVEPVDFVRQMVEKGVLSPTAERRYVVPIPSMLTWLGERYGASTPEAHPAL